MRPAKGGGIAPGPVTRLRRKPLAVLALVLAGCVAIAAASVGNAVQVSLASEVDDNWRGSYDILVRPAGTRLGLESTHGLIEPNFLGFFGAGGITLEQLRTIHNLADVEVAAPVSMLGYLSGQPLAPTIHINPDQLPDRPTLYQATIRLETDDGLGPILVQEQTADVLLGAVDLTSLESFDLLATSADSVGIGEDGVEFTLAALPPFVSPLMAVDPSAEQALLGEAGDILRPLLAVPLDGRTAAAFDRTYIADGFPFSALRLRMAADGPPGAQARPVVPIVVSDRTYAALTLRLDVVQIGQPLAAWPTGETAFDRLEVAGNEAGDERQPLPTTTIDLSSAARPFEPPTLAVGWLGSSVPTYFGSATRGVAELGTTLATRPTYAPPNPPAAPGPLGFEIVPVGGTNSTDPPPQGGVGLPVHRGVEQDYRRFTSYPLAIGEDFEPLVAFDNPFLFAPVGEYDLRAVQVPANPLTYVPLGAYDPVLTDLVANSAGVPLANAVSMHPTQNPAGLIAVPPLGITDMASAELLRGAAPIDAIRVRVAGLRGYDETGRNRVERVASQIAALGLEVDVVAGSSPQPVRVFVPAYDLTVSPPADLGWIQQGWTTLGAATRVERALSRVNLGLLGLSLATATVFLVGIGLLSAGTRRREAGILRALGWEDPRIIGRQVGEVLPGAVLVAAMGVAAWWWSDGSSVGLAVGLATAAEVPIVAGVGAWLACRRAGPGQRASELVPGLAHLNHVGSRASYALRTVVGYPLRTAVVVGSLGVVAAAGGVGLGLMLDRAAQAGPTRLADYLNAVLSMHQWGLLGLSFIAGAVLAILTVRLELIARRGEFTVLRAVGWEGRHIASLLCGERILRAAAAAAVGLVLALALSSALGVPSHSLILASSVALALSSVAWTAPAVLHREGG